MHEFIWYIWYLILFVHKNSSVGSKKRFPKIHNSCMHWIEYKYMHAIVWYILYIFYRTQVWRSYLAFFTHWGLYIKVYCADCSKVEDFEFNLNPSPHPECITFHRYCYKVFALLNLYFISIYLYYFNSFRFCCIINNFLPNVHWW